jgi:hypothetical protein
MKARARLENAADVMAAHLLKLATDSQLDSVQLGATNSALDRAGLKPPTEIAVSQTPIYEQIIWDSISSERPAELQPLGAPPPAQLEASNSPEVLDCEVVEQPVQPSSVNAERPGPRTHPDPCGRVYHKWHRRTQAMG